jgi:hypothetical protein
MAVGGELNFHSKQTVQLKGTFYFYYCTAALCGSFCVLCMKTCRMLSFHNSEPNTEKRKITSLECRKSVETVFFLAARLSLRAVAQR